MAKWVIGKGLDDYLGQLQRLSKNCDLYIGKAVHDGAGLVADELRNAIESIPSATCSDVEREGMLDGMGISKMQRSDGLQHVKIGMDGYNSHVTKKYPNGHPNAMIARAINAGTSWRPAYPFINKVINASKAKAEAKMKEVIDSEIAKLVK